MNMKMKNSKYILGLFVLVLAYASVGTAAAPPLTFTFKDVKAPGAIEADTYGVNDSNTITGDYIDHGGVLHGMILKGSKLTTIDHPNGSATTGYGINNDDVVVGNYTSRNNVVIGFRYSKGKFHDIAPPGSLATIAYGINDKGDVVGLFIDSTGQHGFLLPAKTKKYTTIDAPKAYNTTAAWGINNQGWITLFANDSNGIVHTFLLTNYGYTILNVPGATEGAIARALNNVVNNKCDIVGRFSDSSGAHGWLLLGVNKKGTTGTYYTFDDPKANNNTRGDGLTNRVNGKLLVVGRYTPAGGENVGYEATVKLP
jgi:hypothetical protein